MPLDGAVLMRVGVVCAVCMCCRKKRVNQAYLVVMMEMGIPKHKAEVALTETGNVGVEVATEWLFSAPDTTQFEHYTSDTGEVKDQGRPMDLCQVAAHDVWFPDMQPVLPASQLVCALLCMQAFDAVCCIHPYLMAITFSPLHPLVACSLLRNQCSCHPQFK